MSEVADLKIKPAIQIVEIREGKAEQYQVKVKVVQVRQTVHAVTVAMTPLKTKVKMRVAPAAPLKS